MSRSIERISPRYDFLNRQLYVGDEVVFISPRFKEFGRGVISKINPKMCTIKIGDDGEEGKVTRHYYQVCKINI